MKKSQLVKLLALALVLAGGVPDAGAAGRGRANPRGCAPPAAGGEWRSYNHDLLNSRNQPAEKALTPARAATLAPRWVFASPSGGSFQATPTVADGCVFLASDSGGVFALNADTGQLVWKTDIIDPVSSSPTVMNGKVFLSVNKGSAPYLMALDEETGQPLWRTRIDKQFGSDTFSSPAVFNGMVMAGISGAGAEAGTTLCPGPATSFGCGGGPGSRLRFRGSYVILDERTGRLLKKAFVISDRDFKAGFAGGGVWSTAAVDVPAGFAYVGTGNPFSAHEHPNTNAILKIDVDPRRHTFGQVVGRYHGTTDLYVDGATYKPVCGVYVDVFTCDPPDFDFGASPQLFTDARGHRLVGDMQKAGVYHAADRGSMAGRWQTVVGGPVGQFGGEATATFDGRGLYTGGSAPGLVTALTREGSSSWVAPIADGIHFQSMSSAAGVIYTTDTRGLFDAWDAASGKQVLARSLGSDIGQPGYQEFSSGASPAIARHTVYVPAGSTLVAYRAR